MDRCEDGMIEGYPDLEIMNINKFMGDLMESIEALMANVDTGVDIMGRIAEVKEEDALDPEVEELAGPQEDHDARQSPEIGDEEKTRSTRLPPPPSKTQEVHNARHSPEVDDKEETRSTRLPTSPSRTQKPGGMEDTASGGPRQGEAGSRGATGRM